MPDFPRGATATEVAASVWGYGSRILSNLSDARAAMIDNVDAAISTRSSHAAADIWGIATRTITELKGTPRSDLLGEDLDFEAGVGARKAKIDNVDASIASRLALADFDTRLSVARATKIDNVDAAISSRSSHAAGDIWAVAARTLTNLDDARAAKVDNLDELISTRLPTTGFDARLSDARATKIDNLDASIISRLSSSDFDLRIPQTTIDIIDSVPVVLADVEGTASFLTTDEYPKTVDLVTHELGAFFFVEGIIDLSANVAGETVTVTEALSLVTPVDYKEYATDNYTGVQDLPALYVITKSAKHGLKVQMTMATAPAADREYPFQFFARQIA